MNDLISRQAAIKAICEDGTWLERQGCTDISMAERKQRDADILSDLPSAQPEQRWIKTSKRLPEMYMPFYATVRSLIDDRENWVIEGYYNPITKWGIIPMIEMGKAEVVAWMPKEFPSPYQEEREGEG